VRVARREEVPQGPPAVHARESRRGRHRGLSGAARELREGEEEARAGLARQRTLSLSSPGSCTSTRASPARRAAAGPLPPPRARPAGVASHLACSLEGELRGRASAEGCRSRACRSGASGTWSRRCGSPCSRGASGRPTSTPLVPRPDARPHRGPDGRGRERGRDPAGRLRAEAPSPQPVEVRPGGLAVRRDQPAILEILADFGVPRAATAGPQRGRPPGSPARDGRCLPAGARPRAGAAAGREHRAPRRPQGAALPDRGDARDSRGSGPKPASRSWGGGARADLKPGPSSSGSPAASRSPGSGGTWPP